MSTPIPDWLNDELARGSQQAFIVLEVTNDAITPVAMNSPIPALPADRLAKLRGERLKQAREARRLTQQDLASSVGLKDKSQISKYERGHEAIPFDRGRQLAALLGVPVVEIADVPRVVDDNAFVFHVHVGAVRTVHAAICPLPDDRNSSLTPSPQAILRDDARAAVKRAAVARLEEALDDFFDRRARHYGSFLSEGWVGPLVDDGHWAALIGHHGAPPVTVYDINPEETSSPPRSEASESPPLE